MAKLSICFPFYFTPTSGKNRIMPIIVEDQIRPRSGISLIIPFRAYLRPGAGGYPRCWPSDVI